MTWHREDGRSRTDWRCGNPHTPKPPPSAPEHLRGGKGPPLEGAQLQPSALNLKLVLSLASQAPHHKGPGSIQGMCQGSTLNPQPELALRVCARV